jgi:hypothetical protein
LRCKITKRVRQISSLVACSREVNMKMERECLLMKGECGVRGMKDECVAMKGE